MRLKKLEITEAQIQRLIMRWLSAVGYRVYRRNTGAATYPGKEGKEYRVRFNERGACDLWFVLPPEGLHVEIEVKRPGRKPAPHQIAWIMRVNAEGGRAFWSDELHYVQTAMQLIRDGYRPIIDWKGEQQWTTDGGAAMRENRAALERPPAPTTKRKRKTR